MTFDRGMLLVTGAAGGIGSAVCRLAKGYCVAASDRDGRFPADVRNASDVTRLFDDIERRFGPVTHLATCAGIIGERKAIAETRAPEFNDVLATNLVGTMLCCREAVKRGAKAIVTVSSMAALNGGGNGKAIPYAVSKAGVEALTVGLAREARGTRVNCVRPGAIDTPMTAFDRHPEDREYFSRTCPLGRVGEAEEVARTILWLLSDEASYVNGAVLSVSGGR